MLKLPWLGDQGNFTIVAGFQGIRTLFGSSTVLLGPSENVQILRCFHTSWISTFMTAQYRKHALTVVTLRVIRG
jgi:hypothetical protein